MIAGAHVIKVSFSLTCLFVWLLLAGCQMLGPTALSTGRSTYNDVIARSGSEQTLGLIVRLRYADPIGLLTVSSVTAGLKFSAEAKSEVGFGPRANYAGQLVPFSAGIGYEDSPTIAYAPVDGEAFLREWLSPVTMEMLALVLQSWPESALLARLIERMNGLRSGANTTVEERTAFHRAATLLVEFRARGMASWVQQSGNAGRYELILSHYAPAHLTDTEELLRLLEVHGEPARARHPHPGAAGCPGRKLRRSRHPDAVGRGDYAERGSRGGGAARACRGTYRGGKCGPSGGVDGTGPDVAHPLKQKRARAGQRGREASRLVVLCG